MVYFGILVPENIQAGRKFLPNLSHFVKIAKKNCRVSVHPFEVGSHTGYISRENKDRLKKLYKFCKKDIKLKLLKNNISAIAVLSSYFIFNISNIESWHTPSDYIMPPFMNM